MKKILLLFTVLTSVLFTACESEEMDKNNAINRNKEGFSLSYHVQGIVSATTRSTVPPEGGEDTINSLYILFFENKPNSSGRFIEAVSGMPDFSGSLTGSGSLEITFPQGSALNNFTDYKILFCANINPYSAIPINSIEDLNEYCDGQTEKEVSKMLLRVSGVANEEYEEKKMLSSNLAMSGSTIKLADEENVSVEMNYLVSRFDVFCQASGYELVSASVWNAYTEARIWEDTPTEFTQAYTRRYYGVKSNNGEIISSLYTFENQSASPEQNDSKTTCLIIGLRKTGETSTQYFRANIHGNNMGQELQRNNMYRTTVLQVEEQGATSEYEAYLNDKKLIDIDINGWMQVQNENIQYDGDNILAIPTKEIILFPWGDQRTYKIFTLGEGHKLSIIEEELPNHITATLNQDNELIVEAEPSELESEGNIKLGFAGMTANIAIRQKTQPKDFLTLNPEELPQFSAQAGNTSDTIQVIASGEWIAEIYNGTNFSFNEDARQVAYMKGEGEGSFNINTIQANNSSEKKYAFVQVKLKEHPEISRAIVLQQAAPEEYALSVTPKLIQNIPTEGGSTPTITVHANASWTAKIIDYNTNAGFNSSVTTKTLKRDGDATFTVKLDAVKTANVNPKATVEITIDGTSIREIVQIEQKGIALTLSVSPDYIMGIPATGGKTQKITVTSNGSWTAKITDVESNAGFNSDVNNKVLEGTGNKTFDVILDPVRVLNTTPLVIVEITLNGTSTSKNVMILQNALYDDTAIKVLTKANNVSTLANTTSPDYYNYVYNLGQNMRDKKLFGLNGEFYMPGYYKFEQATITSQKAADAHIYQVNYTPTVAEVSAITTAMNADKNKLLIISYDQGAVVSDILNSFFPNQGFSLIYQNLAPYYPARYFNQRTAYANHPLITYLLKDGPFTNGSKLNANNIGLYSYGLNVGMASWPNTFIPIIMAKNPTTGLETCVFGIDPTRRMIWIGDPGIFGSSASNSYNYVNYQSDRKENIAFLNNFIAWMSEAVLEGESFITKYK